MNNSEYIQALKLQTDQIFIKSLENISHMNVTYTLIDNLNKWYENLKPKYECCMLRNSIEEIEISLLNASLGLYRSSYISLRLALEMFSGFLYFSTHDIEYKEWLQGEKDLIWSEINNYEKGITSKRFFKAYFHELESSQENYLEILKNLYRNLSENVHGNPDTWNLDKPELKYNSEKIKSYQNYIKDFYKVSAHLLCVRFLKETSENSRYDLITDENLEDDNIRKLLGGAV